MTTLSPEAQKIVKEMPEQIKEIASYVLCNQTNSISETIRNLFKQFAEPDKDFEIVEIEGVMVFDAEDFKLTSPEDLLKDSKRRITKVKRLGDGLVFEVGQITNKGVIEKFYMHMGNLIVQIENIHLRETYLLSELSPIDVFKDEEGNEIKEGEIFFYIMKAEYKNNPVIDSVPLNNHYRNKMKEGYKYFLHKSSAETYLLRNKKCFSVEDIKKQFGLSEKSLENLLTKAKAKL